MKKSVFSRQEAFGRNLGLISHDEQEQLASSLVAIAGCGGVGGMHAHTLARLGVGRFRLADFDTFSVANFNRQIGATMDTVGRSKSQITADMIRAINPEAEIEIVEDAITADNAASFVNGAQLVVDGVDFFEIDARRQLFAAAWDANVPALTAAPLGFSGTLHVFAPGGMSFDEYFDLHDDMGSYDQCLRFIAGLAPAALHLPYTDFRAVDPETGRGPSSVVGSQMAACLVGAEAVRILLRRGSSRLAPSCLQLDAFRGKIAHRRPRWGNRGLIQRLKLFLLARMTATLRRAFEARDRAARALPGAPETSSERVDRAA